ncbi:hypothetical protein [Rhodococcus rhodochrous]|uniref:hypothetical protein n=1 Tax=Rhodococcus rhodochrous TaxID=1829 RepID=UPI0021BD0A4B|nr:hypothetical protein [Rhodococcus rhodochrous]
MARADVARTAAAVLSDPDAHEGRTYDLTGPHALSIAEVARSINEVSGARDYLRGRDRRAGVRVAQALRRP